MHCVCVCVCCKPCPEAVVQFLALRPFVMCLLRHTLQREERDGEERERGGKRRRKKERETGERERLRRVRETGGMAEGDRGSEREGERTREREE